MKIFIDAHIIIDAFVYNNEEALSIINFVFINHPKPVISVLTIAILNYFIDKKYKQAEKQKAKIGIVLKEIFEIATTNVADANKMLNYKNWEDAFQYFAAQHADSELIITNNQQDFYFSKIKTISRKDFSYLFY
jgi:predicted nucleic acid-binding protein